MFSVSLDDSRVQGHALSTAELRQELCSAARVETPSLVEWEMSAGQVGALVGAMCLVFAVIWAVG